jgi:hypothetical protein
MRGEAAPRGTWYPRSRNTPRQSDSPVPQRVSVTVDRSFGQFARCYPSSRHVSRSPSPGQSTGVYGVHGLLVIGVMTIAGLFAAWDAQVARVANAQPHPETFNTSAYGNDLECVTMGAAHGWMPRRPAGSEGSLDSERISVEFEVSTRTGYVGLRTTRR